MRKEHENDEDEIVVGTDLQRRFTILYKTANCIIVVNISVSIQRCKWVFRVRSEDSRPHMYVSFSNFSLYMDIQYIPQYHLLHTEAELLFILSIDIVIFS